MQKDDTIIRDARRVCGTSKRYGAGWALADTNWFGGLLMATDTTNTLGVPRGAWLSRLGNTSGGFTMQSFLPNGASYLSGFKAPSVQDSVGFATGIIAVTTNTPFATDTVLYHAGSWVEMGSSGSATIDSLYGVSCNGAGGKTKVGLVAFGGVNTRYDIEIKRNGSSLEYYVNGTLRKTITTNLPSTTIGAVDFTAFYNADKTTFKTITVFYSGLVAQSITH